jgi:PEP-CTERM motif-containing protein
MEITGTPVPEPGTLLLIGSGISALALRRKKAR